LQPDIEFQGILLQCSPTAVSNPRSADDLLIMGDLLLSTDSVLMCPHGGIINHAPSTYTSYRVSGRPPMLLGDTFTVAGCPFIAGHPSPCMLVQWMTASTKLIIRGRPILTNASVGLCQGAGGAPQGPVVVAATQLGIREPDEFTSVPD
jgi:hypothetical protein